jgi:hypothetical protein
MNSIRWDQYGQPFKSSKSKAKALQISFEYDNLDSIEKLFSQISGAQTMSKQIIDNKKARFPRNYHSQVPKLSHPYENSGN